MSSLVVVDASLAVKWLVNEVHSDLAIALARSWADAGVQPAAPYLMPVEVANALYRRVGLDQLTLPAAGRLLGALLQSGIELREPSHLHERAVELAAKLDQRAVYDSHYLALAHYLGCELWTADRRFYRAATASHPDVRWVGELSTA